jgi:hypothetical protein
MRTVPRRWLLRFGLGIAFAVAFALAGSAFAQEKSDKEDALDQARKNLEVAAQKTEGEIRTTLLAAEKLAATDPARALDLLKGAKTKLDDATELSESRRATLKRIFADRIRVTEAMIDQAKRDDSEKADQKAKTSGTNAAGAERNADADDIKRDLSSIRALREQGKTAEADRQAADLAKRYPNNPAAQAAKAITSAADRVAEAKRIQSEKENGFSSATGRDIDKSASLPKGDIEFPPPDQWARLTKARGQKKLTEKEQNILKTLDSSIKVDFKDSRLEDVIDYLQTRTGLSIILDKTALDEAGVTNESLVSANFKQGVSVRTLLRVVLNKVNLTYIVKDEAITVLTPERAKNTMVTRTYYLGDLVTYTDARLGPVLTQALLLKTGREIVEMIKGSVDPSSWRENGGEGTIVFDPRTLSIVVKQSSEVHSMLESGYK